MAHVVHIELQAVAPGQRVAPVDGGIASDARFDQQFLPIIALVELGFSPQIGARAHNAHVALEHVQELRHLIDRRLAHEGPDARHTRVVGAVVGRSIFHHQVRRVHLHRAQLVHREVAAVLAHARRVVEDRALVLKVDERRANRHDDQHKRQRDQADDDVADTFSEAQVHLAHALRGKPCEHLVAHRDHVVHIVVGELRVQGQRDLV